MQCLYMYVTVLVVLSSFNCDGWWWEWLRVGEWVVVVVVRWNWRCSDVLENWFVGVVGAVE